MDERQFSQLELLMLENFVNQAAMAIYHAHNLILVHQDLARKEEELSRLRRAGLLISSRVRLEETLESILQMAMEVTGAHYGIFRLVDKRGQTLNTRAVAGETWPGHWSRHYPSIPTASWRGLPETVCRHVFLTCMKNLGPRFIILWMPAWKCGPNWLCH